MSEMVERVVNAILGTVRGLPGCDSDRCICGTMDETLKCQYGLNLEHAARAAIEAMREPTVSMIDAGFGPVNRCDPKLGEASDAAGTAWRYMIDAALR